MVDPVRREESTSSSSSSSSSSRNQQRPANLNPVQQQLSSTSRGQQRQRSATTSSDNVQEPAAQRQRVNNGTEMLLIDKNLIGTRVMKTNEIKLNSLLNENIESIIDLEDTHLDVQILRIITPNDGKSGNAITRYQRNNQQKQLPYTRTLLCRTGPSLVYIMMSHDMNRRLYHRDLLLRDNGTITVGSFLRILGPHPIIRNMNGIPLIKTDYPAIALETPDKLSPIFINSYIEGNKAGCAVLNGAIMKVTRSTPLQTTCTGKHCDKQRPYDWTNKDKKCGCFISTNLGTSNLCIVKNGKIKYRGVEIPLNLFASASFQRLYMTGPFPPNLELSALEHTEASYKLKQCMKECIELINDNEGFEVVLWYSRGEINDLSLTGMNTGQEAEKTDSGKLNYHVVSIRPLEKDFLDPNTFLGDILAATKFDVEANL